jgi:hypothetical protein
MRRLGIILILVVFCLLSLSSNILATQITYSFFGTASYDTPNDGWWNIAYPGGTIKGTFSFDDSLFSGTGAYTIPGNTGTYIKQEYPDAYIEFTFTSVSSYYDPTLKTATWSTYPAIQTTARPDLNFVDSTIYVGFVYDNLDPGYLGSFINMKFYNIATLDNPQDLIGAVGTSLNRTAYQTNMGYNYDIQVTGIVGQPLPLPSTVLLLGSGLVGLAGWRRFRKG